MGNLNISLLYLAFRHFILHCVCLHVLPPRHQITSSTNARPFDFNFLLFPRISRLFRASHEPYGVRAPANSAKRAKRQRGAAVRDSRQVPLQQQGNLLGRCQSPGMLRWLTACACAIYLLLRDVIIILESA